MTAAEQAAWIVIWYRSGHAFEADARQLLRGGPPWAGRTPRSMRGDWDAPRLRRAERCSELARLAYIRAQSSMHRLREADPEAAETAALALQRLEIEGLDTMLMIVSGRVPVLVRSRHVDGYMTRRP